LQVTLDTEILEIASYTLIIRLGETNYIERDAIIFLNIVPRDIDIEIGNIVSGVISVVSGNDLSVSISLTDGYDTSALLNAEVLLELNGVPFDNFKYNILDGTYSIIIPYTSLVEAFFFTELMQATIIINKANYSQTTQSFTIEVKMTEIFPGFPMFYFLMIVGAIVAVVGSLVASRQIRRARIPTFVKKTREMSKNIKGRKTISDSLLYPSKEEYVVKKLGDKWETLDLSLGEILGHSTKKKKNLSKETEFEGGSL